MLLQEPQQWRPAHLKAAKVQVTQGVPVTSLVEPHFIPRDGDEGSSLTLLSFCYHILLTM